jgi:hypothetical protein
MSEYTKTYGRDCDYIDIDMHHDETDYVTIAKPKKIINGSKLTIGNGLQCVTVYNVDQHFNWFQKLMWKWAFGIKVEDFSEE